MKLPKIKEVIEKVKELPTLPVVAKKVNIFLYDPKSNTSDLARIIEKDQSITAKVLKFVNSSYYALPQRVTSIKQAITLLGYKQISHIVMTLSIFNTLKGTSNQYFNRRDFWMHSIATAIMSVNLAKYCMYNNIEDVFTAALLHDIGKVFMDGFLHEEFAKIIDESSNKNISFYEAELKLFDVDHAMIGEWVARAWMLPLKIIAAIKHHHQELENRKGLSVSNELFIDFIRLADIIVRREKYGKNGDGKSYSPELSESLFKRLPIYEDDINNLLRDLKKEIQESETILSLAAEE